MADKEKKRLDDINPRAWEHPADRAALSALKQLPQLDNLVRALVGNTTEKSFRLISLASAVRVSERQFPLVNRLVQDACYVLDWREKPEIFVSQSPLLNAGCIGVDKPFITLNSVLLEMLSEQELLAVISHELAHIMSGHVLYKTLLFMLMNVSQIALSIPITGLALQAIVAALKEWDRKSELSADRASLLVLQEDIPVYGLLMKVAGGHHEGMNLEEFFVQAQEYEEGGTVLDSVHKLLNLLGQTHPFAVLRLKELKSWVDLGAYAKILGGDYTKRSDSGDFAKDFEEARQSYKEEVESSKDPLAEIFTRLGKGLEETGKQAGKQVDEIFRSIFGGGKT